MSRLCTTEYNGFSSLLSFLSYSSLRLEIRAPFSLLSFSFLFDAVHLICRGIYIYIFRLDYARRNTMVTKDRSDACRLEASEIAVVRTYTTYKAGR